MKKLAYSLILIFIAALMLLAGCAQQQAAAPTPTPTTAAPTPTTQPDTVFVSGNPLYGQILVDGSGMTLYYFLKDTRGAATNACTGACATLWPAFNPPYLKVSAPLLASDFDSITTPGGGNQVTYMGWPLYHYSGDKAPGDTNGYKFNNLWYVMAPTGVVTTAPTTTVVTTRPTTVPTTIYSGGGGY